MSSHPEAPAKKRARGGKNGKSKKSDKSARWADIPMSGADNLLERPDQHEPLVDGQHIDSDDPNDDDETQPETLPMNMRPTYRGKGKQRMEGPEYEMSAESPTVTRERIANKMLYLPKRREIVLPFRDVYPTSHKRASRVSRSVSTEPAFIESGKFASDACRCTEDPKGRDKVESDPPPTLEALDRTLPSLRHSHSVLYLTIDLNWRSPISCILFRSTNSNQTP